MEVDVFYCLKMVEEAGIVCVPGSGFGTPAGETFHLRYGPALDTHVHTHCMPGVRLAQ